MITRVGGGAVRIVVVVVLVVAAGQSLTLSYRQGGERCKPAGRRHSSSLKKLFLEYGVEPWWRDRTPLLYVDKTLVAVADYWGL